MPMTVEQSLATGRLVIDLLRVLIWPVVALFVLLYFGKSLRRFANSLGEFSLKAAGVEATAKRQQIEVAALIGAAAASKPGSPVGDTQVMGGDAKEIANVVEQAATPRALNRLNAARILWVDDRPENNIQERRALEALGIRITLSTSTNDALEKTLLSRYDAIISDMGRPPDPRAGYTLLDALRQRKDRTPFVIYAGSNSVEHKVEAKQHGALGSTNRAQELIQLILSVILEGPN